MSIDFLEYLRLQFPWLVMPSTNPFSQATPGIPKDPDEVPPIIHIPGPPGGIGQDVKGKQPEQPNDQRTPQQKREDEAMREKIERENEKARKELQRMRERVEREAEAQKRINRDPENLWGQTEAEKKKSEVFRRLMNQKVVVVPERPGTPQGGGVLKAGASKDDPGEKEKRPSTHRWREWSPEANAISEQLQNIDDPERRRSILEDAVDPEKVEQGYLWHVPLPHNIWDYMSGGRMPAGLHADKLSPEELQEKVDDPDQKLSEIEMYQYWEMMGRPGFDDPHRLYEIDPFEVSELGQDIPLRKEFDPDDFISDFLDYKGRHYIDPATRGENWRDTSKRVEHLTEGAFLTSRKKENPSLPYSPYQAPPTSKILELNELRDSQLKDYSVARFFEENAFDRDPKTGKPLDSKEASGMTDEAELFLRRIARGIADAGNVMTWKHITKDEEAADALNQIWQAYQDAAANNFEWIDENFDANYWTSMSPSDKVDLWIGGWLNNLEEQVYGQGTEVEMWDDERGEPAWGQDRERESIVRYGKPPYDTMGNISALDARWDKLSEAIKDKLISLPDNELADWIRGLVGSYADDPMAMAGEVEWGENWVAGVFKGAINREATDRLNDIIKRTLPPPLSGASGVTEYTTTQFPFSYTQEEMDKGLKTATWRKMSYPIARTAEVGQLFHYVTEDGRHKMYRITDVIEEKRWENVSKRWKEEGYTSKEKLAEVHRKIERMEGPHNKARWDKQSDLFPEGKGIWHDIGKTIVFEEATDLTDELTNLGAKPKPKPQERFKALPSEESQPTDIGSIPVHLDEEGNVDLSKAPSFKDLPPADQDPTTRVTEGFTAVDTTSGEIVDVTPSKFILGDNTEFGNLAQRRFNYRDMPFFSVEHALRTWENGAFNEKIYKHPLWAKPGSKVQKKYYPNVNEKPVSVGKLPDGTQVTLPGNVNLMYNLVFESMRQNPEVLKRFLESSGKFPAVEVPEGSFWEKAFPAILEGVWKHLREVQPVVTVNVAGNREWSTPKHKEIMRKTIRAIKEVIEGKGYRMKVISGVQIGADQMGLDIAKELGLEIGGWAPMEWIVDGRKTGKWQDPSLEQKYPGVKEFTGGPKFQDAGQRYTRRTEQNVRSADFTIQFTLPERYNSPGARGARKYSTAEGKKLYDNPDVSPNSKFLRALRRADKNPLSYTISPEKEVEIKAEIARSLPGTTRYLRRQY